MANKHAFAPARHCLVIAVLFAATALLGRSEARASCGDYLLHGPMSPATTSGVEQSPGTAKSPGHHQALAAERPLKVPQSPSPCASGRCHSLPMWPPINHPSRMIVWKQTAMTDYDAIAARDRDDRSAWAHPADGLLPVQPLQVIDVPPPRHACSHA